MRFLKPLFDFYLNSSIHVGIEVCCFVLITCFRFELPLDQNFLGFVFFGTITGYNFIKYAGVAKLHHRSLATHLKLIQVFSFFCFLALVFFVFQLSLQTLFFAAFFGLFTVFYAVPVFPGKKNLRNLKGIKIFVIAFVVAGLTVFVPFVNHHMSVDFSIWEVFLQRFLFIIAVLIPFEIRDLDFDEAELGTIPQKIGERNAKILGVFLLVAFVGLEFLKPETIVAGTVSTVVIGLVSAGFILFSRRHQSEYYASFWVEAIPIFWALLFWSTGRFFI
ncbi:MAG TPA: hypothetical protein VFM65_09160 [Flavobacteriaceae bacterium]|nr:hypothetical protein [Flavobacteriaceae bacterium]